MPKRPTGSAANAARTPSARLKSAYEELGLPLEAHEHLRPLVSATERDSEEAVDEDERQRERGRQRTKKKKTRRVFGRFSFVFRRSRSQKATKEQEKAREVARSSCPVHLGAPAPAPAPAGKRERSAPPPKKRRSRSGSRFFSRRNRSRKSRPAAAAAKPVVAVAVALAPSKTGRAEWETFDDDAPFYGISVSQFGDEDQRDAQNDEDMSALSEALPVAGHQPSATAEHQEELKVEDATQPHLEMPLAPHANPNNALQRRRRLSLVDIRRRLARNGGAPAPPPHNPGEVPPRRRRMSLVNFRRRFSIHNDGEAPVSAPRRRRMSLVDFRRLLSIFGHATRNASGRTEATSFLRIPATLGTTSSPSVSAPNTPPSRRRRAALTGADAPGQGPARRRRSISMSISALASTYLSRSRSRRFSLPWASASP